MGLNLLGSLGSFPGFSKAMILAFHHSFWQSVRAEAVIVESQQPLMGCRAKLFYLFGTDVVYSQFCLISVPLYLSPVLWRRMGWLSQYCFPLWASLTGVSTDLQG